MSKKKIPVYLSMQDCETDEDGLYGRAICAQYNLFHVEHQTYDLILPTKYTTGYECYMDLFSDLLYQVDKHAKGGECKLYLIYFNASFDIQRMIESMPDHKFRINLIASRSLITTIDCDDYPNIKVEVRDLMLISPTSLAKFTESFAPKIKKLKRSKSFDSHAFDISDPDDIAYAIRDVDSMTEAYWNLAIELDFDFCTPPLTTPSLAIKKQKEFYRSRFGSEWAGLTKEENIAHKKYCHGGRNLIGCGLELNREIPCVAMDIVSAYVAVMTHDTYPLALRQPVTLQEAPIKENKKQRFLISLKIHDYYPPHYSMLPSEDGIYASGTFISHITDREYYALTKHHKSYYSRLEIIEVLMWGESKCGMVFEDYSKYYYAIKQLGDELNKIADGSGDSKRAVGKLMGNACYGKMIQKYYDAKEIHLVSRDVETTTYQDNKGDDGMINHRYYAIGAMITGAIRASLYNCIEHYGSENLINGDTDSLKMKREILKKKPYKGLGTELGCYKYEKESDDTRIIVHAPKCYVIKTKNGDVEKSDIIVKGIVRRNSMQGDKQLDVDLIDAMLNNKQLLVIYKTTANTLKRYIYDKQLGYNLTRELTRRDNVRGYVWDNAKCYYTLPIINEE